MFAIILSVILIIVGIIAGALIGKFKVDEGDDDSFKFRTWRCIPEIQTELEKDISDAKRKAAAATELENEQYEKTKIQKEYEMMAYKQRTYYDELVKAGFSEEQAWEMVRMPFGIPYTPGYAV